MATRLACTCLTAVVILGMMATTAAAQSSQVSQYVQTPPRVAGPDPGAALPMTGLVVLPLLMAGILAVLVGLALRRRLA